MIQTTPFLLFDGNCAEAMAFYHECLGGELELSRLGDTPMKDQLPPEKHGRIINAHLKNGAVELSAADWMASPTLEPKQGNMRAVFLTADTREEIELPFQKLSEGASRESFQDLHDMPFGSYGQFTDKFGVPWIFRSKSK